MAEYLNDEQRDTYVNGLLAEQSDAEQHLEAAKAAGSDTDKIVEHLKSVKAELSRVGYEGETDDKKSEKRPASGARETR